MKRYWIAAGTLLLSTSTIAWAQTDAKVDPATDKTVVSGEKATTQKTGWATDKGFYEPAGANWDAKSATFAGSKAQTASWSDWSDKSTPFAAKSDMASWETSKVQTASWDDAKQTTSWGDAKLQTASFGSKDQWASWDGAKANTESWDDATVQTALLDSWADSKGDSKLQTASHEVADTGMGGPLEETTSFAPRVAAENYPPCSPGPGDDRCIQLYEPGVRAQLAAWNEPTGGLAEHSATTAMGGPYEPVEAEAADMASVDQGAYSTMAAAESNPDLADHAEYQGVGGPIEAQSGYPPCSPGPSDDRCIQLYESGVTGAGN